MLKYFNFVVLIGGLVLIGGRLAEASGYQCIFRTSCYEATGCRPDYLEIQVVDIDDRKANLVTPGNTFPMIKYIDKDEGIVAGTVAYSSVLTRDTMYLLTISPNQSSRLSIHTYLNYAIASQSRGTCAVN